MVYAAVAGQGSHLLAGELYSVLGRLCQVALVAGENRLWAAAGGSPDILLWQCAECAELGARCSVLVLAAACGELEQIRVSSDCVVVADMADDAAARFASARGLRLLDCGLSSKASLTFSSIGRGTGVISLQRSITDLYGNRLEPFDMPLNIEPVPHYPLLAAVGLLLLAGKAKRLECPPICPAPPYNPQDRPLHPHSQAQRSSDGRERARRRGYSESEL